MRIRVQDLENKSFRYVYNVSEMWNESTAEYRAHILRCELRLLPL